MAMPDFSFYQTNAPDYLEKSFAGNLIRYAPNGMAPLFALSSMSGDKTALSVEHGYFSKTMIFPSFTIDSADRDSSSTTFPIDDATAGQVASVNPITVGDLFRSNTTGEIVRVVTVSSATSIVVARSVGRIAAGAVADDSVWYHVGTAFEQGSDRPASRLMTPVRVLNYTQIFRNAWAIPRTLAVMKAIVGNGNVAESKQDCAMFHAADIEKALIFGQRDAVTVNGQYMTTMDGVVETTRFLAPAGNTSTASSTTTFTQLETMLNGSFDTVTDQRNGNERTVFVGGAARTVINNIGRLNGTYQLMEGQTSFGLQFNTFKTSRGTFRMIEHPLLNSNTNWAKMAISVDLPSIKLAYLPESKQLNQEYGPRGDVPDAGQDATGGCLTSELTVEILNPAANAVIYGLTAAAVG